MMNTVEAPLFISSRLMAALKIDGVGTFHVGVAHHGRTSEGRMQYEYVVEDVDGNEIVSGKDIRSGVGDDVDYSKMMATLLHFLSADGEAYRYNGMGSAEPDDGWIWNVQVAEWAYQYSDELALAAFELNEDA